MPDDLVEAERDALLVGFTHWTLDQVDAAPYARVTRMLAAAKAQHTSREQAVDLYAGAFRRHLEEEMPDAG